MASDNLLVLQATTTQTAGANSTAIDLKAGTPKRGLVAKIIATTVSGTAPTADFHIEHSDDNTTFTDLAVATQLTAAGMRNITFETPKRYVRVVSAIGGTTPSVVWKAYIETGKASVL